MAESIYLETNGEYLKNNPTWHVEDSPWKAQQIIKMLKIYPINLKMIAEVGCGAGEILNQLYGKLPESINYVGYDISFDAIELAKTREKERLKFKHENFTETTKKYDLLIMADVFEHIDDYLGFLKLCKDKSDYTIFHIPLDISVLKLLRNHIMRVRKDCGHLHYFTKNTAVATLEYSGYKIVDSFYTSHSLDIPGKTLKLKITRLIRRLMLKINKDLTVKLIGGYSLLVLTKSD